MYKKKNKSQCKAYARLVMCVALQLLLCFSFSSIDLLLLAHFPMHMIFQKFTDIIHELTKNRAADISRENRLHENKPFTNRGNITAKYTTQKGLQLSYKGVVWWAKWNIAESILWQNWEMIFMKWQGTMGFSKWSSFWTMGRYKFEKFLEEKPQEGW